MIFPIGEVVVAALIAGFLFVVADWTGRHLQHRHRDWPYDEMMWVGERWWVFVGRWLYVAASIFVMVAVLVVACFLVLLAFFLDLAPFLLWLS